MDESRFKTAICRSSIAEVFEDEEAAKKIAETVVVDGRRCLKAITDAIAAHNSADIVLYAHRLKGSAMHIGAECLRQKAYDMECAGNENDIEKAALLLEDLREEFEEIAAFLSEADWFSKVKQWQDRQTQECQEERVK